MKLQKVPKGESDQGSAHEQTAQALLNLRCAVDHCHDGVFIVDPVGNVEFVNPAFEVLTGYSAHEAVGSDLHGGAGLPDPNRKAGVHWQGHYARV